MSRCRSPHSNFGSRTRSTIRACPTRTPRSSRASAGCFEMPGAPPTWQWSPSHHRAQIAKTQREASSRQHLQAGTDNSSRGRHLEDSTSISPYSRAHLRWPFSQRHAAAIRRRRLRRRSPPISAHRRSTLRPTTNSWTRCGPRSSVTNCDVRPDRHADVRIPDLGQRRFTSASTSEIAGFASTVGKTGVAEGTGGKTSFTPDAIFSRRRCSTGARARCRARSRPPWSATGTFKSKLVGFLRAGELYDPADLRRDSRRAHRIDDVYSRARDPVEQRPELRALPAAADDHERRVLDGHRRACAPMRPATRPRSWGCRRDRTISSRTATVSTSNTAASPVRRRTPSRSARYMDPDRTSACASSRHGYALRSVFILNPATTYHWKTTPGPEFRRPVREGGITGTTI